MNEVSYSNPPLVVFESILKKRNGFLLESKNIEGTTSQSRVDVHKDKNECIVLCVSRV